MEPVALSTKEGLLGLHEHDIETPTLERDISLMPVAKEVEYKEYLALHARFSDPQSHKKLLWKIDIRLMPVFSVLYLLAFLDRSNIGNARVAGLAADIRLSDSQYSTSIALFYVAYVVVQLPSNLALKAFRPRLWITFLTLAWGLVVSLQCEVTNYRGLYVARTFLGITQSGLVPAFIIIMNSWYTRRQIGLRIALMFASASLSGSFSGLLAYVLSLLDGHGGLRGWQWIFIVEGILTVAVGLLCPFIILDDIERCGNWLSADERRFLYLRSLYAQGPIAVEQNFKWIYLWRTVKDWKIWAQMYILMITSLIGQSISFTLPVIVKSLGFSTVEAFLIPVPIFAVACFVLLVNAWHSDRVQERFWHIMWVDALAVVAASILLRYCGRNNGVTLFGLVLLTVSGYSAVALCDAWNSNNIIGMKRRLGLPFSLGVAQWGSIIGAYSYKPSEAPEFTTGFAVSLSIAAFGFLVVCPTLRFAGYGRLNRQRDAMSEEEVRAKYTDEQLAEMFDDSPLFRYVL